jgi:CMP-N,N'-diacetyllegionaminic acid synthase
MVNKERVLKPRILGIITARGGSKGLPGKNIIPVLGKPLIVYTIEAALKSELITKTIVSSDDDEILNVSESNGAVPLKRPLEFAHDTSSSEDSIVHALAALKSEGEEFDIFILLQPTSPLRDSDDIDSALSLMLDGKVSAVISVFNIGVKPFKSYYLDSSGFLKGVYNNKSPNMRRQDLPDAYLANGAIYVVKVKDFLLSKSLIPEKTVPYIMSSEKSIDVDVIRDVEIVEMCIKKQLDCSI